MSLRPSTDSLIMAYTESSALVTFFFFNDTATTEIYTLSLHDALPIYETYPLFARQGAARGSRRDCRRPAPKPRPRSEEHTSELQSRLHLVCRLLLEKKKIDFVNLVRDNV